MDKATKVFNKLAQERKSSSSILSPELLGTGFSASGGSYLYAAKRPKILVTYGYRKGKGGSHKQLASNVRGVLKELGHKNVDVLNAMQPKDVAVASLRSGRYVHKVDAGWGITSPVKTKHKTKITPDFGEKNFVLGSKEKVTSYGPGELHKKYKIKANKKIITIGAGESGSLLDKKTKALLEAVKGRKDVHVVAMAANAPKKVKAELSKLPVTVEGYLPKGEYNKVISSSRLNINSGNPQTILDQLKFKNTNMNVYTPGYISEQNALAATKRYGLPSADFRGKKFKPTVNSLLDKPSKYRAAKEVGAATYAKELKEFKAGLGTSIAQGIKTHKLRSYSKAGVLATLGAGLLYHGLNNG